MKDLITEEMEIVYVNDEQLSYEPYVDGYVELYYNIFRFYYVKRIMNLRPSERL